MVRHGRMARTMSEDTRAAVPLRLWRAFSGLPDGLRVTTYVAVGLVLALVEIGRASCRERV